MKKEIYSYNSESLTCNDRPILPIMGEFHFSRYPAGEWKTALKNMQQGGVDIVATYVFWIHHEETEGEWDFSGRRNLKAFLKCCQEAGMKVWLRIGPWAHGECRNGGFPGWLVEKEKRGKLSLRTDDPQYLKYVDIFFTKIAEQADGYMHYMHKDGGPVIGIQIENEYGHYGGEEGTDRSLFFSDRLGRCLCAGRIPAGAGRVCGCSVGESYPRTCGKREFLVSAFSRRCQYRIGFRRRTERFYI